MKTKLGVTTREVTSDALRPAGPDDECYYCRRKLGSMHKFSCVLVTVKRTYQVFLYNENVGTWTVEEPASWDRTLREFFRNGSSWCANNMMTQGMLELDDGVELPFDDVESDCCTICDAVSVLPIGASGPGIEALGDS